MILPGLIDVHEHFRFPGNPEKETVETGVAAALKGGYKSVCLMANTNPVIDNLQAVETVIAEYNKYPEIDLYQFAAVTKTLGNDELVDIEQLHKVGVIGFSNDGKGIQDAGLMREACSRIKGIDSIISVHLEEEETHPDKKSEYLQLERDLEIVKDTGVKYHAAHISCIESIELIKTAKSDGLNISCEATPHHLLLSVAPVNTDGRYKVNPPLRSEEDRQALVEALLNDTIDMIATDHAPHTAAEKSKPFEQAAFGFIGSELALPLMYTHFVKPGLLPLEKLIELMSTNSSKRFGIPVNGEIEFDETVEWVIGPDTLASKSKNTPFLGDTIFGKIK
jgi:dihydroorotase